MVWKVNHELHTTVDTLDNVSEDGFADTKPLEQYRYESSTYFQVKTLTVRMWKQMIRNKVSCFVFGRNLLQNS